MGSLPSPDVQSFDGKALGRKYARKKKGKGSVVVVVTIIRVGVKTADDDNFPIAYKPIRDSIAASLGIDDGDPRIKFKYGQCASGDGEQGTIVRIEKVK